MCLLSPTFVISLHETIILNESFGTFFSFNDRIRDAILGGSPFGHPLQQGFVTGLVLQVLNHLNRLAFL